MQYEKGEAGGFVNKVILQKRVKEYGQRQIQITESLMKQVST